MSRLEFLERRKVLQLLPQQGVQLEALPVTIKHSQHQSTDKLVTRTAPFLYREIGDLHWQPKPESLERTHGHCVEQPTLRLGAGGDGAPQQIRNVVYFIAQSLKPQAAGRFGHGIKLTPQQVGADHDGDGQTHHALRKLGQRTVMFFNSFIAEVDSKKSTPSHHARSF
jgi:hypothetical protein